MAQAYGSCLLNLAKKVEFSVKDNIIVRKGGWMYTREYVVPSDSVEYIYSHFYKYSKDNFEFVLKTLREFLKRCKSVQYDEPLIYVLDQTGNILDGGHFINSFDMRGLDFGLICDMSSFTLAYYCHPKENRNYCEEIDEHFEQLAEIEELYPEQRTNVEKLTTLKCLLIGDSTLSAKEFLDKFNSTQWMMETVEWNNPAIEYLTLDIPRDQKLVDSLDFIHEGCRGFGPIHGFAFILNSTTARGNFRKKWDPIFNRSKIWLKGTRLGANMRSSTLLDLDFLKDTITTVRHLTTELNRLQIDSFYELGNEHIPRQILFHAYSTCLHHAARGSFYTSPL